jgi:undecaprenyl-diphosphatase
VLIFLTISVAAYFALQGRFRTMAFLLVTTSLGWFLMDTLKEHYGRKRPTVVEHLMGETSLSFPSGHAKMSAVVYLTLAALLAQRSPRKRVKIFWLTLAIGLTLLIGCSRLYLGVHYPSDVLAGWLAGTAWALFAMLLARVWDSWKLAKAQPAPTSGVVPG